MFEPIIKKGTAPVRSRKSGESGVFDLRGNVWEWTGDYFDPVTSPDAVRDPSGPAIRPGAGDSRRVLRLLDLALVPRFSLVDGPRLAQPVYRISSGPQHPGKETARAVRR